MKTFFGFKGNQFQSFGQYANQDGNYLYLIFMEARKTKYFVRIISPKMIFKTVLKYWRKWEQSVLKI